MLQKEFYKTQAWRRARYAYIQHRESIDGGLCEECKEEAGRIVHHIIWLNDINCNDENISLNPDNFRYLCQECHNKQTNPLNARTGRVMYGENGEVLSNTDY